MEVAPSSCQLNLSEVVLVCIQQDITMSSLVCSISPSASGNRCYGPFVVQGQSACLSTCVLTFGCSVASSEEQGPSSLSGPILAITHMVLRSDLFSRETSLENPNHRQSLSCSGLAMALLSRDMETMGLACEQGTLMDSGLSSDIAEIILNARASSKPCLYALKCRLFTSRGIQDRVDPVHCPVLEILQERFTAGAGICRSCCY